MPDKKSPLAPFRHTDFRVLWSATQISSFGGQLQAVGAAWMMTQLTDSATLIALVQASTTLPIMLFALLSGALADIFDRRTLLIGSQIFMAAASFALALVTWQGLMSPWLLLCFTFLIGVGGALYNPPWQASMGDLVPRDDLAGAVTLNSVGFNLMRSIGPAVGGIITAAWGAAVTFTCNAFSYLPLLYALHRWHPKPVPRQTSAEPFVSAVGAGLRYVALSPNLMRVMIRAALFGFAAVAVLALLPLVAKSHPEGGSLLFGVLLGCYGLGAILGAVANPYIRARWPNEVIVSVSFLAFAGAVLLIAWSGTIWVQALAIMPAGAAWVLALSLFNVSVQLSTPRWVVSRSLALYQTATFGGMALGSWLWGSIANQNSTAIALSVAAVPLVFGAIIGRWLPVPEFGTLNLDPINAFKAPQLRLDLRGRSGPIMIMIDYRIKQEDVSQFLDLMGKLRNVRRRDGARNWALLRDLENPDVWSESYHIATWDEYVRHNLRRTKSDSTLGEQLRALHQGEGRPSVHRMIERHTIPSTDDTPLIGKMPA